MLSCFYTVIFLCNLIFLFILFNFFAFYLLFLLFIVNILFLTSQIFYHTSIILEYEEIAAKLMLDASNEFSMATGELMVEAERKKSILIARIEDAAKRDMKGDGGSEKERRLSMMPKEEHERRVSMIQKEIIEQADDPRAKLVDYETAKIAAQMIEDESLSYLITDAAVAASLKQDPKQLFQARCWGKQHQGKGIPCFCLPCFCVSIFFYTFSPPLHFISSHFHPPSLPTPISSYPTPSPHPAGLLRGALTNVRLDNQAKALTLWKDLTAATDGFKKGSYILTTKIMRRDPTLDPFLEFRQGIEKQFAWLHGFNSVSHDNILDELREHDINDPAGRILSLFGVRPSDEKATESETVQKHILERKKMEKVLVHYMEKLSVWNTYFGINYVKEIEEPAVNTQEW